MNAFAHVISYKYDILAITYNDKIWHIWFDGDQPLIEELCSPSPDEYYNGVKLLRAMKGLYK